MSTKRTSRLLALMLSLVMVLTLLPTVALADSNDGVSIDIINFPDDNFRTYVSSFDTNKDGFLSQDEIDKVKTISVNSKDISSLKGVEFFTNLTSLYCADNQLTSLDVSNNTELTNLYCYNNSHLITLSDNNTFDLSTLPGFDVELASNFVGGTVSESILTATDDGITEITYDYKCASNYTRNFKLTTHTLLPTVSATITEPVVGATPDTTVTPGDTSDSHVPQTGDNGNMTLWIAMLFISGCAVFVIDNTQKRKKAK